MCTPLLWQAGRNPKPLVLRNLKSKQCGPRLRALCRPGGGMCLALLKTDGSTGGVVYGGGGVGGGGSGRCLQRLR